MPLIALRAIQLSFGGPALLDGVDLAIEPGERIGLVGRNGAGKSTLMRLVEGVLKPDAGQIDRVDGARVARMEQDLPGELEGIVFDVVSRAFGLVGQAAFCLRSGDEPPASVDTAEAWRLVPTIEAAIARVSIDPDAQFDTLSGGQKRRVLLARALVRQPDVLLLDEPTNHLDIPSVEWLEDFLLKSGHTLLFVTHDRAFLQRLATRIVEIDRGRIRSWDCDYRTYVERREQWLADEAANLARFDKRIAAEEVWAGRNVEARRTKSVGRLKELERLRRERSEIRASAGNVRMAIQQAERSGRLVVEAKGVSWAYEGGETLVKDLDLVVIRGDRIGVIGPNGCGKTTLIRLLLGEMIPAKGEVRLGTNLSVVYFDQAREQLDPNLSVADAVADGNDHVTIDGRNRHVHGYLNDFLFESSRARVACGRLSGGEKNRLLLARLFLKPSNVLVLDEPTNDLDAETLELLEEKVAAYNGTVIVVSHDRAFLNAVVTSTLVFEGAGVVREYAGGYDDWIRQRPQPAIEQAPKPEAGPKARVRDVSPTKISFKDRRDYDELPARIEKLEVEHRLLAEKMNDASLYAGDGKAARRVADELATVTAAIEAAYTRFIELEERIGTADAAR